MDDNLFTYWVWVCCGVPEHQEGYFSYAARMSVFVLFAVNIIKMMIYVT